MMASEPAMKEQGNPPASVLERYASRAVPRYTSYPTAPHFTSEFPSATYARWLRALDTDEAVSVYFHVPFCRQMCWYCGCNRQLVAREEPVAQYVAYLHREIALVRSSLPARMPVSHLHWGGGTPTALPVRDFESLMKDAFEAFDFRTGAEIALESDPRTLTDEMIALVGRLGFNRASFGVQEFDPRVQQAINRIQPPEMVAHAVNGLRSAGVSAINFDLIYGLPFQTTQSLLRTITQCLELRPDRIALFGYAHVPWMAKNQRMIPEEALPDGPARAEQAAAAAAALSAAGYQAIGLDHFALPGDSLAVAAREGQLHRNFQGYTTDSARTMISLGVTAIGRTPEGIVQNHAGNSAWMAAIDRNELPVAKGIAFTADDKLRGEVIERLMCAGTVNTAQIGQRHGRSADWDIAERETLSEMMADGLVRIDGNRITITDAGLALSRVIASVYDAYLESGKARHSVAL